MIASDHEMPLTTAEAMVRWRWFYSGLGAVIVVVSAYVGIRNKSWDGLLLLPFLWVSVAAAGRARRYEKIMRDPGMASRIQKYRTLRKVGFEDACRRIEEDGVLVSCKKVIMGSPFTWKRKQGFAHFRCDPFEVLLYEKNGRVGSLTVLLK